MKNLAPSFPLPLFFSRYTGHDVSRAQTCGHLRVPSATF